MNDSPSVVYYTDVDEETCVEITTFNIGSDSIEIQEMLKSVRLGREDETWCENGTSLS